MTNAIREVDPEQPVFGVMSMERLIDNAGAERRVSMLLLLLFAGIALLLSALGIYGVMAYTTNQRRHEIGIRMALGARGGDVLRLVLGQGMRLVAIGLGLGLVGAWLLSRVLASQLYGITRQDPLTYLSVAVLLGAGGADGDLAAGAAGHAGGSDAVAEVRVMESALARPALRATVAPVAEPVFTIAVLARWRSGIGANTAIFSVVRGILLRPLPYADADRVVSVYEQNAQDGARLASYPTFEDWHREAQAFDGLAFIRGRTELLRGQDGNEQVIAAYVSPDFFKLL